FILAIVNCYVYQFRCIPLIPTDLKSTTTALAVLDHYAISLVMQSAIGICFFITNMVTILSFSKQLAGKKRTIKRRLYNISMAVGLIAIIQIPFSNLLKPTIDIVTITWNVQEGYWKYGYLLGSIKNLKESKIIKPDSFDKIIDIIENLENSDSVPKESEFPDIILIVNESYFDLYSISNIQTSKKPTEFIDSLENVKRGYVVNPNTVTANSEFEILTSNSIELLNGVTAFTHFSCENLNSIVKNLIELNYDTYAIHPAPAENYRRADVYLELGFQNLNWLSDFPEDVERIRDYPSDAACFDKIIELYEAENKNRNKFIYNLTLQNHGNYDIGMENIDIKVLGQDVDASKKDFAEEYLNSLHYTDKAFKKLIEYFECIDKPVIICMIGDHAPNFAGELANIEFSCDEEKIVKTKSTPFVLWANYPIEAEDFGYSSMIYAGAKLFKTAGLPLTGYQKYLLKMEEVWPIVTVGICGDGKNFYSSEKDIINKEYLDNYFALEYNNIKEAQGSYYDFYNYSK
ncbi:MAG: LTA synthase family protein, partial [Anaeroplasmataceae bacterium]|nr:LTA synthase family protein [Anaeroplasmataceae bacterium]